MSQSLIPISGGVQIVQTSLLNPGALDVLSPQYIQAKGLQNRPTEWVPGGRPIYRRLPSVSETYQIDFFADGEIGYVFIPWGDGIFGPVSLEVVSSDSKEDLIIKGGVVVWKYGTSPVRPAIVNARDLGLTSGRYLVAYRLVYDDAPTAQLYAVENFSLTGSPLNITSSTDVVIGWRNPAVNAFLNSTGIWSNRDTFFPNFAQPTEAYLSWTSDLSSAYSNIVLRCPSNTAYTGTATLSYVTPSLTYPIQEVSISADSTGQFFEFIIPEPSLQTGWRVDWSNSDVAVQSITVSGVITQIKRQEAPSTTCTLVIYPENLVPKTVVNSVGRAVPAVYCNLAFVDINNKYQLEEIQDIRYIIHRDYKPVADWLTLPFDQDLINLYEEVEAYSKLWMSPTVCMDQEYISLYKEGIIVKE